MNRVLFLCSRNRLRSPTAEHIFGTRNDMEVASGGLSPDAETPCMPELVEWATIIFVMEKGHKTKLTKKFKRHLKLAKIIFRDIPDDFAFMAPDLVDILQKRVCSYLPQSRSQI
jgi:predicted protein tyrosine phosphatase